MGNLNIELFGKIIDWIGVVIIVLGAIIATVEFLKNWSVESSINKPYLKYRQNLGRVILLGLEFLIAGDIIQSVATSPTFTSVGVLALIVVVRLVLSMELQMEVDGRWPWQREKK